MERENEVRQGSSTDGETTKRNKKGIRKDGLTRFGKTRKLGRGIKAFKSNVMYKSDKILGEAQQRRGV